MLLAVGRQPASEKDDDKPQWAQANVALRRWASKRPTAVRPNTVPAGVLDVALYATLPRRDGGLNHK